MCPFAARPQQPQQPQAHHGSRPQEGVKPSRLLALRALQRRGTAARGCAGLAFHGTLAKGPSDPAQQAAAAGLAAGGTTGRSSTTRAAAAAPLGLPSRLPSSLRILRRLIQQCHAFLQGCGQALGELAPCKDGEDKDLEEDGDAEAEEDGQHALDGGPHLVLTRPAVGGGVGWGCVGLGWVGLGCSWGSMVQVVAVWSALMRA